MSQNVLIPLSLLEQIVELLEELNLSEYHPLSYDCGNILWALKVKKQKLELRGAYARIIAAANEEERDEARLQYLLQKRSLCEDEEEPF